METATALDASNHPRVLAALAGLGAGLLFLSAAMLHCLILDPFDECDGFGWFAFAQGGVYAVAVWLVLRHAWRRTALLVILAVALLARLIALPSPPVMSTDIYRYVWDGRVQAAGINPYRYIPNDERLAGLRDDAIYPNINRLTTAPTIYPPVAQMIFLAVTRVSETLTAMKVAMLCFDMVAMLAIIAFLRREGQAPERVLIYAWHPLPIWEFSAAGHIDAAAIALMCIAFWLTLSNRRLLAGAALALSALVKPFALVISPALWRPWDWRMPVAFVATAVACYLPYLGVGAKVLGYAGGYGDEEGYRDGRGFFLVRLLRHRLHAGGGRDPRGAGRAGRVTAAPEIRGRGANADSAGNDLHGAARAALRVVLCLGAAVSVPIRLCAAALCHAGELCILPLGGRRLLRGFARRDCPLRRICHSGRR
jgi:alpha-1,6-mannosyltransferase